MDVCVCLCVHSLHASLLTSPSVASHSPWPHRGGTRRKTPEPPRMNVLLPTKWRLHSTRASGLPVPHRPPDRSGPWSNPVRPIADPLAQHGRERPGANLLSVPRPPCIKRA